jgi:two-component system NarL family response regulator
MNVVKILVADDHVVFRMGIRLLMEGSPNLVLCAEAKDGVEAVQLYVKFRPDVMIMDLRMPLMSGIDATKEIIRGDPRAQILMLSSFASEEEVYQAVVAGARGYLKKDASREEILNAIATVNAGTFYLPPVLAASLAERNPKHSLTEREHQVLQLMTKGLMNKEIASVLEMSENTVKTHVRQVFEKLEVNDRTEAVAAALRRGLIAIEDI